MVIDTKWAEDVRAEIQQQARDYQMQTKGAMVVIEAMLARLNEPEPPAVEQQTDEQGVLND